MVCALYCGAMVVVGRARGGTYNLGLDLDLNWTQKQRGLTDSDRLGGKPKEGLNLLVAAGTSS